MRLILKDRLAEKLSLGGLIQEGIANAGSRGQALDAAIRNLEAETRDRYEGRTAGQIPGTKPARRLYRSIGVDPTSMRPASEALLRRVLKGRSVPIINLAVDAGNLVSLRHLIPVGLYDRDLIEGDQVAIRLGRPGESYPRIGRGEMHLEGRIGLFDGQGGFGNPTGDSRRTSIGEGTRNLLFVAFFPAGHDPEAIRDLVRDAGETMTRHAGGATRRLGDEGVIRGEDA